MLVHTFQDHLYQQARGEAVYQDAAPVVWQCIDHQSEQTTILCVNLVITVDLVS